MLAHLTNIERNLGKGRGAVAPLVDVFIKQVQKAAGKGEITASDAAALIARAQAILSALT